MTEINENIGNLSRKTENEKESNAKSRTGRKKKEANTNKTNYLSSVAAFRVHGILVVTS